MPRSGWKGKTPGSMGRRLAKYQQILQREMSDAVGEATYAVRDTARKQAYQTRTVGATDSITGKARRFSGQSPVRTKVDRAASKGTVSAVPYYTYARTRAITNMFTRFGRRSQLTREGLVVNPANRGNYLQRRQGLKGKKPRLIRFADDPALQKWALKRKMLSRQKIYLSDAELIHSLVTRPALAKNTKRIRGFYEAAFISAGGKF